MNEQNMLFRAERIDWLDIAKGIAILCVILGHLGISQINRIVFVFHMPLFFFISGYLLSNKREFVDFCKLKAKSLLIPYYSTCCIICVLSTIAALLLHKDFISRLWKWFGGSIYGAGFYPSNTILDMPVFIGALWFLWALYWGLIIIRRILDRVDEQYQLLTVCIVSWIGYQTAWYIWLPFDIQAGMTASLFIYIGYFTKQRNLFIKTFDYGYFILSVFIVGWCIKYYNTFGMVSNTYGNGLMDIFGGIASIYLLHFACKYIQKLNCLSTILKWYGSNSIVILCFHIIELNLFPWHLVLQNIELRVLYIAILKILYTSVCALIVNRFPVLRFIFKGEGLNKNKDIVQY